MKLSSRVALCVLATIALVGVFADVLASPQPLMARTADGFFLLPAVTAPGHVFTAAEGWAVWAPLRGASELVYGARTLVLASVLSLTLSLAIGVPLGAVTGTRGGLFDALLSRSVELSGALPTLVVLILARSFASLSALSAFVLVVGTVRGLELARLVRGEVLRIQGQDFMVAARALGAGSLALLRRHVLPHALGPVLVSGALTAAYVVGLEAALSFVGLGLGPELPSWGALLGRHFALAPAAAISITTLSLFMVADGLDDALSARRGRP